MTRKQYVRRTMELKIKFKKESNKKCYNVTKLGKINWGITIACGRHKGEKLISYQQAWDTLVDMLEL